MSSGGFAARAQSGAAANANNAAQQGQRGQGQQSTKKYSGGVDMVGDLEGAVRDLELS